MFSAQKQCCLYTVVPLGHYSSLPLQLEFVTLTPFREISRDSFGQGRWFFLPSFGHHQ